MGNVKITTFLGRLQNNSERVSMKSEQSERSYDSYKLKRVRKDEVLKHSTWETSVDQVQACVDYSDKLKSVTKDAILKHTGLGNLC